MSINPEAIYSFLSERVPRAGIRNSSGFWHASSVQCCCILSRTYVSIVYCRVNYGVLQPDWRICHDYTLDLVWSVAIIWYVNWLMLHNPQSSVDLTIEVLTWWEIYKNNVLTILWILYRANSYLSCLERFLLACVVRNVAGSSPVQPTVFISVPTVFVCLWIICKDQ